VFLEPRHYARHRALRQRFAADQRFQRFANPACIRPGQIRTQDGFVDLPGAALIARENLTPELTRATVLLDDPLTWYLQLPCPHPRGNPASLMAVAVTPAGF
jgi:hypothetical protein